MVLLMISVVGNLAAGAYEFSFGNDCDGRQNEQSGYSMLAPRRVLRMGETSSADRRNGNASVWLTVNGVEKQHFVVEKDGSLTDVSVQKGIGAGCDEESIRVIKNAPKWNPGKQRGNPVRVRFSFPIVFKLD